MRNMSNEFNETGSTELWGSCKITEARWKELVDVAWNIYRETDTKSKAIKQIMEIENINGVKVTEKERICLVFILAFNAGRITALEEVASENADALNAINQLRILRAKQNPDKPQNRLGRWN